MEVYGTTSDTECAPGGSEQKEKSALALSKDELEEFTLSCIVCRNDIPLGRAKRRKQTCSVQCFDKMKAWYKYQALKRKCPACHAPYSEKQRADFRQWRVDTGQLRAAAGRPPRTREDKLAMALQQATDMSLVSKSIDRIKVKPYSHLAIQGMVDMEICYALKELLINQNNGEALQLIEAVLPKTIDTKAPGQDSISKSDLTSEEINHAHDQGVRTIDCNTLTGDADVNQCTGWQGNSATSGELDNRDEHGRGDDS